LLLDINNKLLKEKNDLINISSEKGNRILETQSKAKEIVKEIQGLEQLKKQNEIEENRMRDNLDTIELELSKVKDKKTEMDNKIMTIMLDVKHIKDKMQETKSIKD